MKHIKPFLEYLNTQTKQPGQIISEEEGEDILIPNSVETTGHIGAPIKSVRSQKLTKEPKVKTKKSEPNYPDMQKRKTNSRNYELNSLPSQS